MVIQEKRMSALVPESTVMPMATHERILRRTVEILERSKQLAVINAIAASVNQSLDLDQILNSALQHVLGLLGFETGAIYLLDESSNELFIRVYKGVPQSLIETLDRIRVGEGFIGKVAEVSEPLIVQFPSLDPKLSRSMLKLEGFQFFVSIQLRTKTRTVGVLSLASRRQRDFDSELVPFLSSIGDVIGAAMENARLYHQLTELLERERKRANQLRLVNQVGQRLSSLLNSEKLLSQASRLLRENLGFTMVSIFTVDEQAQELVLRAIEGDFSPLAPVGYRQSIYQGMVGWVARHGEPLLANDVTREPRFIRYYTETKSELDVPIKLEGKVVGVIGVESSKIYAFSEEDISLLQIVADHVATGLQNVQLLEESKKQIDRLRQSEQKYRTLIESAPEGIMIVQEDRIRYANRRATEITGHSLRELYVLPSFLDLVADTYRDLARQNYERQLKSEEVPPYEIGIWRGDGSQATVEVSSSLIEFEGKAAIHNVLRDVTEQKLAREQLLRSEKLAAIGQLAAGISHELNNPLTSVLGYSELILAEGHVSESARRDIEMIVGQAHRARKIIQNLLAFARSYKPQKSEVHINELIETTLALRNYHHRNNNIQVIRDLADDLPRTLADRDQLQQAILNIIINAEQAMLEAHGRGTLLVGTRLKKAKTDDDPRDMIEMTLTDDGGGIPAENLRRIFDPFFTTKSPGVGSGLGLSISYGIVKEHGGEIYALSEEGKGATFVIELPVISGAGGKPPLRDHGFSSREKNP